MVASGRASGRPAVVVFGRAMAGTARVAAGKHRPAIGSDQSVS